MSTNLCSGNPDYLEDTGVSGRKLLECCSLAFKMQLFLSIFNHLLKNCTLSRHLKPVSLFVYNIDLVSITDYLLMFN
jgi:hypothetical protein